LLLKSDGHVAYLRLAYSIELQSVDRHSSINSGYTYHMFSRHDFSAFWALFTDNLIMRPVEPKKVENELSGKGCIRKYRVF
jgi:hypothetical protein